MLNQIQIIGRLGGDAQLRYTGTGKAVAAFSVATEQTWKDQAGTKQAKTQWFRVVLWGRAAESLAQYLVKGGLVYVGGRMESHEFQSKEGQKITAWELIADQIRLLGGHKARHVGKEVLGDEQAQAPAGGWTEDDIPL